VQFKNDKKRRGKKVTPAGEIKRGRKAGKGLKIAKEKRRMLCCGGKLDVGVMGKE